LAQIFSEPSQKYNNYKFCEINSYKKGKAINFCPSSFLLLLDPGSEIQKIRIRAPLTRSTGGDWGELKLNKNWQKIGAHVIDVLSLKFIIKIDLYGTVYGINYLF
jgi:hypothetical protein